MTHRLLGLQRPAHNARDLEYSDRLMPLSLAPASIAANSFSFTPNLELLFASHPHTLLEIPTAGPTEMTPDRVCPPPTLGSLGALPRRLCLPVSILTA